MKITPCPFGVSALRKFVIADHGAPSMHTALHRRIHFKRAATRGSGMIPRKYGPLLFSLILSGLMSLIVSGISTLRLLGLAADFPGAWLSSWWLAWAIAFPTVAVIAPITRKIVERLIQHP